MARFYVGQKVRLCMPPTADALAATRPWAYKYAGTITTITAGPFVCLVPQHNPTGRDWEVDVRSPGGDRAFWCESELEPIDDDGETTTWERVEEITGWNPTKEKVHATTETNTRRKPEQIH